MLNFGWSPLDLGVSSLNSPEIDGYVKTSPITNLAWDGVEYGSFTKIPMFNGEKNNNYNMPVIGQAWHAYNCTDNILCIAAYLSQMWTHGYDLRMIMNMES